MTPELPKNKYKLRKMTIRFPKNDAYMAKKVRYLVRKQQVLRSKNYAKHTESSTA